MTLHPAATSPLDRLAEQIRSEHAQVQNAIKTTLTHAIHAGALLVEAKGLLKHGNWLPWLAKKARLPARTAQVYMRLYKSYGGAEKRSAADLPLRQALRLLAESVPDGECVVCPDEEALQVPEAAVSRTGDLWRLGPHHRLLCGDGTNAGDVARLLAGRKPKLMVTDPPYGVELDLDWRVRAGHNRPVITPTHQRTSISGDARADWSEAFQLVPSIQVAYVWHSSVFTREVLDGLLRLGFLYPQQIIWNKCRTVIARTHYWYQHEPCWYVRKKNAPWYGKAGDNSTVWDLPSPKMSNGSDEDKFDHPAQKPIELMRRPILNHTKPGELVYDPFLGSGTTLAAAELGERICLGIEIDPKHVDVSIQRWQQLTGKQATLNGRTFDEIARERLPHSRSTEVRRLATAG